MQGLQVRWTLGVAFACLVSQGFTQQGLPATVVPASLDACSKESDGGKRLACYDREIAHLHQLAGGATRSTSALASGQAAAAGGAGQMSPTSAAAGGQTSHALPTSAAPVQPSPALAAASVPNTPSSHPASVVPPPGTFAPPDPNNPADIDRFGLNPELVHERQEERRAPKELAQITARVSSVRYKARGEFVVGLDNGQTWEQADHDGDVEMGVGDTVTIKAGILSAYYMRPRAGRIVHVKRIR